MVWEVEYTNEFEKWWNKLSIEEQKDVAVGVGLLGQRGTRLGYPYTSQIMNSKYNHMRELRVQHAGRPYRILYTFDPRRCAILLIGGDKTGNQRWYDIHIPIADKLYDEHLKILKQEGLI